MRAVTQNTSHSKEAGILGHKPWPPWKIWVKCPSVSILYPTGSHLVCERLKRVDFRWLHVTEQFTAATDNFLSQPLGRGVNLHFLLRPSPRAQCVSVTRSLICWSHTSLITLFILLSFSAESFVADVSNHASIIAIIPCITLACYNRKRPFREIDRATSHSRLFLPPQS